MDKELLAKAEAGDFDASIEICRNLLHREAKERKAAEDRELADKVIADSAQAAALTVYIVENQFSDPDSVFLRFLSLPGAFMKLEVTRTEVRFYINGVKDDVYETLPDDEVPLNLTGYKCYFIPFSSLGWTDLPNSAMVSALYAHLHKHISALPYLNVNNNFIELDHRNYYGWTQSQRSMW